MDDIATFATDAGKLIEDHAWLPLASLAIALSVRLVKDDRFVAWFPVTIAPRYRSWLAVGLGVVSGVLQALVGGAKWPTAIIGGLISAYTAIAGHDLIVESIRKGRDIGIPKAEHTDEGPPGGPVTLGAKKSGRPGAPYSTPFRIFAFAVMLLALSCADCKRNADGTTSPLDWGKVVKCAPDVGDLIGTITEILVNKAAPDNPFKLSRAGQDELGHLARQHGASAVLCAVETLWRDWSNPTMAAVAPWRTPAAARARAFLDSTGATIQRDQ